MQSSFWLKGLGILLALVPVAGAQKLSLPKEPLQGRSLFEQKGCIICHAINGEGGKIGPDLGRKQFYGSLLQLAGILWNHWPAMSQKMREAKVPHPEFTGEEMEMLIGYLYMMRYQEKPGNVLEGKRLLSEKQCLQCHSVAGQGGEIGPRLDVLKFYVSPLFMAQAMWNHGPKMEQQMQVRGLQWPQFQGEEIRHLSAYLRVMNPESMKEEAYSSPGNPERGRALFEAKGCKKCHAVYGEGGTTGPDLGRRTVVRNVTEIAGAMWNHATRMRIEMKKRKIPWPEFSGSEMADMIAYIYFIGLQGPPGDPAVGQGIFSERGCSFCHAIHGKGGKTGPDLARIPAFSTPMQLAQVMWNHAPLMQKEMEAKALPWPQFAGNEMTDLYAYLQAVRSEGKPQ